MFTISIDTNGEIPIYEQIYIYIREEIIKGNLSYGTKLPSSRGLASYLEVSRNTIDMAYGQLLSEGYIESYPKKGYFVCDLENLYLDAEVSPKTGIFSTALEVAVEEKEQERFLVDFSPSGVDMDYFPYGKWRKLLKECLYDDNKELFLAGEHQGDYELRKSVQTYLHQSRGVNCSPDQIIIGAGSDYLLLLLSKVLGNNQKVAMENPAYVQAHTIFKSVGYEVLPVPVDIQGMKVEELMNSSANIAFVTPSHQFPTGTVMSAKRRQKLFAWATGNANRYIIEDDYDSEFRYEGKPIPALQSQDPFDKVIYIGTLSKAIAPGIRLSFMVLPQRLLASYRANAGFYYSTVSRVDQKVISEFLDQGHFERHLNRMRKIYKIKHDVLVRELKNIKKQVKVLGGSAGSHVLLQIGDCVESPEEIEQYYVELATQMGVKVYALSNYYLQKEPHPPTLLLGFAKLKEEEMIQGVQILCRVFDQSENRMGKDK